MEIIDSWELKISKHRQKLGFALSSVLLAAGGYTCYQFESNNPQIYNTPLVTSERESLEISVSIPRLGYSLGVAGVLVGLLGLGSATSAMLERRNLVSNSPISDL